MAITTLDPKTALILIDLQKGIVSLPTAHPMDTVLHHASALAAAFRRHDLPIVMVNVAGRAPGRIERALNMSALPADWTEIVAELSPQPGDHCVTKHTWGAFANTDLQEHLKKGGVTQVVIAGVATSIGAESTAREAYSAGFNVTLAIDAMTDMSLEAHENSISRIFPRLGETGTTAEIVACLDTTRRIQP